MFLNVLLYFSVTNIFSLFDSFQKSMKSYSSLLQLWSALRSLTLNVFHFFVCMSECLCELVFAPFSVLLIVCTVQKQKCVMFVSVFDKDTFILWHVITSYRYIYMYVCIYVCNVCVVTEVSVSCLDLNKNRSTPKPAVELFVWTFLWSALYRVHHHYTTECHEHSSRSFHPLKKCFFSFQKYCFTHNALKVLYFFYIFFFFLAILGLKVWLGCFLDVYEIHPCPDFDCEWTSLLCVCSMSVTQALLLFVMLFVTDHLSTEPEQHEALKHIDTHNVTDTVSVRRRKMLLSVCHPWRFLYCVFCVQDEITTISNFSQTSQQSPSPGHKHTQYFTISSRFISLWPHQTPPYSRIGCWLPW